MAALSHWEERVFKISIPQSEPLNQAQIERTDIYAFDARCKGAAAYEDLMKEILSRG